MLWRVPVLGISLALGLTGCSSSPAQDSARPTQGPTAELPFAGSSPSPASPVGPVLPSEAELLRTVTMTGEKGQTPEEQAVVEAWREAASRNQVALARSDPAYEPLLRLIGPMLREEVVAALSDNRRRGEYLIGPIMERVLDVAVSPAGTSAVLQVCEDNSEKKWYDLMIGAYKNDADPTPLDYQIDLVRGSETRWIITGLSNLPKGTC